MSFKKTFSQADYAPKMKHGHICPTIGVYKFFEPAALPTDIRTIERFVADCKKNKISCIIPCLPKDFTVSGDSFALISDFYDALLTVSEKKGLHVGLAFEKIIEECFFCESSPVPEATRCEIASRILNLREYYCAQGEAVDMDFSDKTLMSISLFDVENAESRNISEHITDSRLSFTPSLEGNWIVNAYTCDREDILGASPRKTFNKLNYDASLKYLTIVIDILGEKVKRHLGKTLSILYMNEICFDAPNRRNWDISFNDKFAEMFGFSPEDYYNCLFYSIGEKTVHLKSLFMSCRAKMLRDGIMKALRDFSDKYGLELINSISEPKLADCSWLTGDALANFSYSSCALLDKAYMYGINSLSLSASAAQNFGLSDVYCELYGDYYMISPKIMFKDAINAYAKGCTRLAIHSPASIVYDPKDKFNRKKLLNLATRCRNLLSGGTQISDIAILYPAPSMHSEIYMYQCKSEGFEYPNILPNNDHMTVINMLASYCGQDTRLIHLDVMISSFNVSGAKICMTTKSGRNSFGVLILPGVSVINIENLRLIKKFYDNGGKIIATGRLPHFSAEYHPSHEKEVDENDFMHTEEYATLLDDEVRKTVAYIFGGETTKQSRLCEYYCNSNANGGEAYFLCASKTTSDGTLFCNENLLKRILYSFNLPLDVYISNLPDQMGYDSLNDIYPNFSRLGYNVAFPGGGFVNHIHKKHEDIDIYFFSNTTDKKYSGYVFLKGMHCPVSLNPATGKKSGTSYKYVNFNGEVYTALRLHLEPSDAVLVLSVNDTSSKLRVEHIPHIKSIEHNFLTE